VGFPFKLPDAGQVDHLYVLLERRWSVYSKQFWLFLGALLQYNQCYTEKFAHISKALNLFQNIYLFCKAIIVVFYFFSCHTFLIYAVLTSFSLSMLKKL
jgi:hypothetical protein